MAVISDYLEWRGDLSFEQAPFNEVDNYIISKIGCPDYTGIVPSDGSDISLSEAVAAYFSREGITEKSLGALASEEILKTLKKLPDNPRYSDLRLSGFRRHTDVEATEQFSALTVRLPDGTNYVSFRGTDDSIIGWEENFMMAVMESVPAQEEALDYLKWAADVYQGELIVGGHSKGGNLAFFAASRADAAIQDRIIAVYNNDGPGFNDEFYENDGYKRILDRMHYIVPQHSLIGTLLLQPCDFEVVKCPRVGVGSHDGYCWELERDHFISAPGLSILSRSFNDAIEHTLSGMSKEETEEFIGQLFGILYSRADNLTDLTEQKLPGILSMLKNLHKDAKVNAFFSSVAEETIRQMRNGVLPNRQRKKRKGLNS